MKRVLLVLALMGLTAGVTYLIVTRQMAEDRAGRLAKALMDAESRIIQLEGDIVGLESKVAGLSEKFGQRTPPVHPPTHAVNTPPLTNTAENQDVHKGGQLEAQADNQFLAEVLLSCRSSNTRSSGSASTVPR